MKIKFLADIIVEYLKTEIDGLKITAKEQTSKIIVLLLTVILGAIFGLTALLFANIALAYFFADIFADMAIFRTSSAVSLIAYGYFGVATMYVVLFITFLIIRPMIANKIATKVDQAIQTNAQKQIQKLKESNK